MWIFKRLPLLALFMLFLGLSSCWKASPHDPAKLKAMNESPEEQNTNFLVVSVGGSALPTREVTKDWKIPMARYYDLYACLIDRGSRNKILGIQFKVKVDETEVQPWTDENGCLHWQERIPVPNFYADENYLELERTIEGLGIYKGPRKIKIAVNPWAGFRRTGNPEIVWVKTGGEIPKEIKVIGKEEVRQALAGRNGQQQPAGSQEGSKRADAAKQLWMTNVSSYVKQIEELDKGVALEIHLAMKPVVKLRSLQGDPSPYPIKAGKFRVYAQIVATNLGRDRDQSLILTPDIPPSVGEVDEADGNLRVFLNAQITRRVARGNLQLALRVVPINAPEEIEAFEGLYEIGDYTQLQGKQGLWVSPKTYAEGERFDFDAYLKDTANYEKLMEAHQAFKLEPFEFSTMQIKFETIKPGETATTRTVEYSVVACVRNIVSGNRVRDEMFYVEKIPDSRYVALDQSFYPEGDDSKKPWCAGGKKPDESKSCREIPKTNHEGCLTWIGHVTHKYYKPEELLFPTVRIKHVSSGFTKELTLAINPWDLFATFGRDRRVLTDEYVDSLREVGTVQGSSKGREKIPSLFFINQFSYHTLRFRYEIDEFMNLNVKKMLLWRVDPSVLRYSSIVNGRRATEHLRDGIYLLKAAVQKDYLDPAARGVSIGRDPYSGETRLQLSEEVKKKQYITAVKKLVRVQDGKIITPVEIAMRDLRLMRIRSNMLVQLETIDEKELTKVSILHEELRKLGKERQLKAENGGSEAEYRNFMAAKMRPVYNYVRELSELEMNKPGRLSTPDDFAKFYDEMDELKDLPADFFSKVKDKTLQAYKKNDLTYMPTAPIVDLDSLRDLDSGLEPRVFSGPVTLLLNSNSSYMRPTDNLDEIYCPSSDDCDRIKKELADLHGGKKEDTEYRDSPFFGSIKHLYRKAVDRVIEDMMKLEENYRARNSVASLLYTFVRDYNLTYISLKDKPLIKFDTDKCKTVDDNIPEKGNCLSRTTEGMMPIDQFINEINVRRFANKPIEAEELLGVIDGEALDVRLTSRLCNWIAARAEQVWKESKGPRINAAGGIHLRQDLFWQCISNQLSWERRPDKHTPTFIVERKYKIYQTGDYRFKGGKSMNLNVGASFSLNHSESFSFGKSYNLLGPLNGIPYVGAILSPAALRLSSDESKSRSDGTSISEQAFLVMQQATMDLELLRYEKCAIVRMHPDRFNEIPMFYFGSRGDSEGDRKVLSEITRGLMFCKGEEETKPIAVRERYYYFTQHFTEGDQLDSSDLYNHPWLLGLRGVRDFHTFVALLKAVPYNWKLDAVVEEEGWALQHMMNTYREIHPTFPGLYSILSTEEDKLEYPFEDRPHNSFANGWKKKPVGEGEGRD